MFGKEFGSGLGRSGVARVGGFVRQSWIVGLCAALLAGMVCAAETGGDGWKTYRNATFGYELSYPPDMEYTAYVDGASGALKDRRTGHRLVEFEVWPPGDCPRQPPAVSAREMGIERAKAVTQADGPAGSSDCGDPVTVRDYAARHGATLYELELTCVRETSPESHDDTDDAKPDADLSPTQPVITPEGTKGPTFFVDISPPWRTRILMVDPVGVDPRVPETTGKNDLAILRAILWKLQTFPIPKPAGVCIEDLRNRGFSIGKPPR
jgi:hypothetical protein